MTDGENNCMAMADDLRQWRSIQRADLLAQRMAVSATQRSVWNESITHLLLEGFPLLRGMAVGSYWPFKAEFDPRFAVRSLLEGGARVALPVVVHKSAPLEFREWWPAAPMSKGVLGIPIPQGTDILAPQALLIPPVGFDSQGYRLGYGAGYFDRTLAAARPQPLKIGVAFEMSRIPTIQPQAHDVPMDFIVTEAGIHVVNEGRLALVSDPLQVRRLASAIVQDRSDHHREARAPGG